MHVLSADYHSECSNCDGSECSGDCDIADLEDVIKSDSVDNIAVGHWEPIPGSLGAADEQAASRRAETGRGT